MAAGAVAATLSLPTMAAPQDVDCQLACVEQPCTAKRGRDDIKLEPNKLKMVQACELVVLGSGTAILRYRHNRRWFEPPEVKAGALSAVFARYPPDACSVPSPQCTQAKMSGMKAAIGGHGIDGRESRPGGAGDPCLLGLPCGAVLPPPADWSFRLADASMAGRWTVRLARGTPAAGQTAEVSAEVRQGSVRLDGAWFVPGAQYVYRFDAVGGASSATGEFSVVSRAKREALNKLMQRRVTAGTPEAVAWIDTLMANELDWDAFQLTQP